MPPRKDPSFGFLMDAESKALQSIGVSADSGFAPGAAVAAPSSSRATGEWTGALEGAQAVAVTQRTRASTRKRLHACCIVRP